MKSGFQSERLLAHRLSKGIMEIIAVRQAEVYSFHIQDVALSQSGWAALLTQCLLKKTMGILSDNPNIVQHS